MKEEIKKLFEEYKKAAITAKYTNKDSGNSFEIKCIPLLLLTTLELEIMRLIEAKENDK